MLYDALTFFPMMTSTIFLKPHHVGDATSVVPVGFDRPRGQEALRVTHLDTNDGYAGFA